MADGQKPGGRSDESTDEIQERMKIHENMKIRKFENSKIMKFENSKTRKFENSNLEHVNSIVEIWKVTLNSSLSKILEFWNGISFEFWNVGTRIVLNF